MEPTLESYAAAWERAGRRGRRAEPRELARTREEAWQRFLARGFPTTREEEWRFTSVAPIAGQAFSLADPASADVTGIDIDPLRLPGAIAAELVFVNGRHVPGLSRDGMRPAGSRVERMTDALARRDGAFKHVARVAPFEQRPFVALNTAFFADGGYIELAAGVILEQPIHLLFVATGASGDRSLVSHPRVTVVLGANSQASVVETYAGVAAGRYFTNAVTEIVLGDSAVLDHYKLQYESAEAYHVGTVHVQAQRSATCASHSVSIGGALVRNDIVAVLNGEGVECTLNGLYLADGQRLVDHHTTIDHARPQCGSREVYKGILADRARGVFNGKIIVRPDAQKTDAKQTNRALLLSEDALIHTKPQLEIFANDVKCTHGAAVGQLDDEAMFYLRSRGLGAAAARQMLIHAFADDVLNRLPLGAVRGGIEQRLERQLARALGAA
jgi:Fe-S cluster assembly protein SufD